MFAFIGAGGTVHVYAQSINCINCSQSLISASGAPGWADYYGGGGGGRIVVSFFYYYFIIIIILFIISPFLLFITLTE